MNDHEDGAEEDRLPVKAKPWIITALDRSPVETWRWERRALLALELVWAAMTVSVAPTALAQIILAAAAPITIYGSLLAQSTRSAAARKRERAEALGAPAIELACEIRIETDARRAQILAGLQPLIALLISVALAGGAFTRPIAFTAAIAVGRWQWGDSYGRWRRWMRSYRPLRPEAL